MEISDCPIEGLKLIKLKAHSDARGFFVERFNAARFDAVGLAAVFVQDNHSRSQPGVLRGLHAQPSPPQGKLVGVIRGHIWDVAVDIRRDSPTFGRHYAVELSGENALLFWIPAGFAHGFCVLGDEAADVMYKVDHYYSPQSEIGIRYDDPDLQIPWPLSRPVLSDRDRALMSWGDYQRSGV